MKEFVKTLSVVIFVTALISILLVIAVGPIQKWLATLPVMWATVTTVISFIGITIWVWMRNKSFILLGSPDNRTRRDLRIWATVCSLLMIIAYLIFI